MSERYDAAQIKARLTFLDLMAHQHIPVKRDGPLHKAVCPFHSEKSGSFTIYSYDDHSRDHAHCYGCGWNGDVIKFWMERHGVPFFTKCQTCKGSGREKDGSECGACRGAGGSGALVECASLAALPRAVFSSFRKKQASQATRLEDAPRGTRQKPTLPKLRALTEEEIVALARLRGLDAAGVRAAANLKRVGGCEWPQFIDRDGCWRRAKDAAACWVVTDRERWVAQYRRLDGGKFTRKDGKEIKAWSNGSPTWPLGAAEIGKLAGVLLVEGGADMLAAYHFLALFRRLERVAVCSMLGASCAICADALPFFARKRVRIILHVDEPCRKTGKVPSFEAAARWTEQLTGVGAAVESFSLTGLLRKTGEPVEDLNDLAMVEESAWLDPELRAAFFDFDF